MNARFSGRVALITGGTGGLGRALSHAFLQEDAKVIVTYRDQKEFDDLERIAGDSASSLQGHRVDVTDTVAVEQLVQRISADYGRLDVTVNTVGAYAGGVKLWELDPKVFDQMLALNLRSGFTIARAVVPVMLKQKRGAIVNIASKAAVDHAGGAAAYVASKAAAVAMMDSLAADLKGTGVRVNSVLPSIIDTEINRKAMPKADFTQWPKSEDIARVILFLCSDDANLIHGAAVPVYGDS
jgi:NAD(P)-dependent dehydrogenase (short-subunit alcohol dehydrogenase family)